MKLSDYLSNNDLYVAISNVKSFPFITVNSNTSLSVKFGERIMNSNVSDLDVDLLASLLVETYGSKWDSLIGFNISELELGSASTVKNVTNENFQVDNTGSVDNVNKVSGFNDVELIDDTGSNSSDVKKEIGTKTTTDSKSQLNLKSLYENLILVDKTNIINTTQNDIIKYLTLNIY